MCYTISASALLYSPLIRQEYAERHATSSEPTVRVNDVAFAVHAVVMSSVYYSQFWSGIWGFKVGRLQRLSRPIAGVLWGSILALVVIILLVTTRGKDGGRDAQSWAWIDVVWLDDDGFLKSWFADVFRSTLLDISNSWSHSSSTCRRFG